MKHCLPLTLASLAVATAQQQNQNLRGLQSGSTKWYVYWNGSSDANYGKCVNTCTDPAVEYCKGGYGTFATVEECCQTALSYKCTDSPPPCDECTNAPFTPVVPDATKWYVRDSDSKCVRNCATGDGTDCGGAQWHSWITLYDSMEACCSEGIPWKCYGFEPKVCQECTIGDASQFATTTTIATTTAPVPTNQYYVNTETNKCVENCPVGSGNPACGGIVPIDHTWVTLHADVQKCCQAHLSWKCPGYPSGTCDECTDADVTQWETTTTSTPAGGGAIKWYLKEGGKCVQDCPSGSGCGGTLPKEDTWTQRHDDVQKCCQTHLSWKCPQNPEYGTCPECTLEGVDLSAWYQPPDPDKWYHHGSGKCVKNCEGTAPCGGINEDGWVTKHDDVQKCCSQELSWKCPGIEAGVCPECTVDGVDLSAWVIGAPAT